MWFRCLEVAVSQVFLHSWLYDWLFPEALLLFSCIPALLWLQQVTLWHLWPHCGFVWWEALACVSVCVAAGEKKEAWLILLGICLAPVWLGVCVHACSEGGDIRPVDTTKYALCEIWLNMLNIFQLFCMSTGHRFHPEPALNWLAVTRILTWIPTVVVLKWYGVQLTRTGNGVNSPLTKRL